jgi:hypothetical protein
MIAHENEDSRSWGTEGVKILEDLTWCTLDFWLSVLWLGKCLSKTLVK